MAQVTLVYPHFRSKNDRSIFRFPPLGLGYIASSLEKNGISVKLVDCTFLTQEDALNQIKSEQSEIIGFYSMFSMKNKTLELARQVKSHCKILVAGGPLPTVYPEEFLKDFDIVVLGEGEKTILELFHTIKAGDNLLKVNGIAFKNSEKTILTPKRELINDLDSIPFPARNLFNNVEYKKYYSKFGYTTTPIISSRGCPFSCDFCSQPIFGNSLRFRSAENIVSELEEIKNLGYDRVWFADDCFTIDDDRLEKICDQILNKNLKIMWECLSRVDTISHELIKKMKKAGCTRVFFGIESGNNEILKKMNKQITIEEAKNAVKEAKKGGLEVGAFFILGYPGETNDTILDTISFASSLSLDYCSFTFPYPIPGTALYQKVKDNVLKKDPEGSKNFKLIEHELLFRSDFSENKLKFIVIKASLQIFLKKYIGIRKYNLLMKPLELATNKIFKIMH